jgi:hypothetical protein
VGLTVTIRDPAPNGKCAVGTGAVHHTLSDDLPDDKHMVAVTEADLALGGKCVQVDLTRIAANSTLFVTARAYCIADDFLETE